MTDDSWLAVATADEFADADGFLTVRVKDSPWLVLRLGESLTAVPDVCPHRRVPLSAGRRVDVDGGQRLECRYHGWQFSDSGECAHIPALGSDGAVPPGMRTRTAAVTIADGMVWIAS